MPSPHTRHRRTPQEIAGIRRSHMLLLCLLVGIVYASALLGDFVWSDREDILQGAYRLHDTGDLGAVLSSSRAAYRSRILAGDAGVPPDTWPWYECSSPRRGSKLVEGATAFLQRGRKS